MEEIKQNIAAKSTIVDQAKKLLDADNFRNARNELDKLKDSLREIGSAGSAKDDEFHEQIREIEDTLRTKQKDFNEHINESRSAAETKKTELISQAKKLVSNINIMLPKGGQMLVLLTLKTVVSHQQLSVFVRVTFIHTKAFMLWMTSCKRKLSFKPLLKN